MFYILIVQEVAIFLDFYAKFGTKMARKLRELASFFSRHCHHAIFLFTLVPPRRAPSFLARTSGAVALKVTQVTSTAKWFLGVLQNCKWKFRANQICGAFKFCL